MGEDGEGVDQEVCCGEEVRVKGERLEVEGAGLHVCFSHWDVAGEICLRAAWLGKAWAPGDDGDWVQIIWIMEVRYELQCSSCLRSFKWTASEMMIYTRWSAACTSSINRESRCLYKEH